MNKEKAVIFGRGQYYLFKKEEIEKKYEIIGFIDNNPDYDFGCENKKSTHKVVKPNELDIFGENTKVIVMASRKSFISMGEQLINMGIDQSRIMLGINYNPCFDMTEKLFRKNNIAVEIVKDGFKAISSEKEYYFKNNEELVALMRNLSNVYFPETEWLRKLPLEPMSRAFGRELGTPIDRAYIDNFLENNKTDISRDVMEIAEDIYTVRYGTEVKKSYILHVNGWNNSIKGNLATGEGIQSNLVDCIICTQTIQMIYEIEDALKNIYKLLKKDGVALITIHGISQLSMGDYNNWGEYWRITAKTAFRLAESAGFEPDNINVESFGNVKTVMCFLYGMCQEQLNKDDFMYNDEQFPLMICMRVKK